MTNITFDLRVGGGSLGEVLYGQISYRPTSFYDGTASTTLPAPTVVDIIDGVAASEGVIPTPADESWLYEFTICDFVNDKKYVFLCPVPNVTEISFSELEKRAGPTGSGAITVITPEALNDVIAKNDEQDGRLVDVEAKTSEISPTEPGIWQVRDELGNVAIKVDRDGHTHIGDLEVQESEDDQESFRIRDTEGNIALEIDRDGRLTYPQVGSSGGGILRYGPPTKGVKTSADIQAMIDALPADGGYVVLDEDAEYVIDQKIVIGTKANVSIIGRGRGTVLRAADGLDDTMIDVGAQTPVTPGFTLSNLVIDGNASGQTLSATDIPVGQYQAGDGTASEGKGYGLVAWSMQDMRLENVEFRNCFNSGFRHQGDKGSTTPDTIQYRSCWLTNVKAVGNRNGGLELSQRFRQLHLSGVECNYNGGHGLYADHSEAEYVNVSARKNGYHGVFIHNVSRCSYAGLHAYNNGRQGIYVERMVECVGRDWFAHNNGKDSFSNGADLMFVNALQDGYGPTRKSTISNVWVGAAKIDYIDNLEVRETTEEWGVYFQDSSIVPDGTGPANGEWAYDDLYLLDVHVGPTLTGAVRYPDGAPDSLVIAPAKRPERAPQRQGVIESLDRATVTGPVALGSGAVHLTYLQPDKWINATSLGVLVNQAASGATTTQVGLYEVDPETGDLTLLGASTSTGGEFNTTGVKALTIPASRVEAGRIYALAVLQSGGTLASLAGLMGAVGMDAVYFQNPKIAAALPGQASLPASIAASSLVGSRRRHYVTIS